MARRFQIVSWIAALFVALVCWAGCGEPTDDPEDCTPSERFNEASEICELCPVVRTPQCRPGCGFTIVNAEDGCPEAVCDLSCELCSGPGRFFSYDTLRCEQCPADTRFERSLGRCVACPTLEDVPEQAECELCGCAREVKRDAGGCVYRAYCTEPCDPAQAAPGWSYDATALRCVMRNP